MAAIALTTAPLSRATSTCITHGQASSSIIVAGTGATGFEWDDASPSIDGFVSFHLTFGDHGSLSCMGTNKSWSLLEQGPATLRSLCGNLLLVEIDATTAAAAIDGTVHAVSALDGDGNGSVTLTIDATAN
ncbi:MAG TPA: hypothetical protein VGH87_16895, partial [Polyangiaceae bacterium]